MIDPKPRPPIASPRPALNRVAAAMTVSALVVASVLAALVGIGLEVERRWLIVPVFLFWPALAASVFLWMRARIWLPAVWRHRWVKRARRRRLAWPYPSDRKWKPEGEGCLAPVIRAATRKPSEMPLDHPGDAPLLWIGGSLAFLCGAGAVAQVWIGLRATHAQLLILSPVVAWFGLRTFRRWYLHDVDVLTLTLPVSPTSPLVVRVAVRPTGPSFTYLRATLRCGVAKGWRREELDPVLGHPFFTRRAHIRREQGPPGPGDTIELSFDLPDDAPSSLYWSERRVVYTLQLTGETTHGRFDRAYALPVYDVPGDVGA